MIKLCHNCASLNDSKKGAICKKCRSKKILRDQVERRANRFPMLYLDCTNEDCGHIWRRSLNGCCPKCNHVGEEYVV